MPPDPYIVAQQHNQRVAGDPMAIEINLPNIPLWRTQGGGINRQSVIGRLVTDTMRLALQEVAGHVSDAAPRNEGTLAQSFGSFPASSTGGIEMVVTGGGGTSGGSVNINGRVFSSLPYAIVMDKGRRPGAPISREGIESIGVWAQRKLGLSAAESLKARWAIAQSIIRKGIKATNFVNTGWSNAQPRVRSLFKILGDAMARKLAKGN